MHEKWLAGIIVKNSFEHKFSTAARALGYFLCQSLKNSLLRFSYRKNVEILFLKSKTNAGLELATVRLAVQSSVEKSSKHEAKSYSIKIAEVLIWMTYINH